MALSWATQAEMTYNGLGTRLTSSALGVTTQYASDGQMPLAIISGDKTTTILYGLGPVAEKTDVWNYVLNDGVNVPRQLTDDNGLTTLAVRYNPWGKPIETSGSGNFDASFIGTLIDATTGLIYIGNGQYYDPETGRFLTRNVNPNSPNPYVPISNPIGLLLGPLALIAVFPRGKSGKKGSKMRVFLILLLLAVFLAACSQGCKDTWNSIWAILNPPATPTPAPVLEGSGNGGGSGGVNPGAAVTTPTGPPLCPGPNCPATQTPIATPTSTPSPTVCTQRLSDGGNLR